MAKYQNTFLVYVTLFVFEYNFARSNLSDKESITEQVIKEQAINMAEEFLKDIELREIDGKVYDIEEQAEDEINQKQNEILNNTKSLKDKIIAVKLQNTANDLVNWTDNLMDQVQDDFDDLIIKVGEVFQSYLNDKNDTFSSYLNSRKKETQRRFERGFNNVLTNVSSLRPQGRQHIAFTAFLSKNADYENVVCFDHEITNIGNGYNKSSGFFTAPKDGAYMFISSFLVNDGYVNVELSKNGEPKGRGYASKGRYESSGFLSSILTLVQGDTVGIKIIKGHRTGHLRGDYYSSFTGTLLH